MSMATENVILKAALEYAALGWLVVSLLNKSKVPRLSDWPNQATTDPAIIEEWWTRWPKGNVGIRLGAGSRLIDIECDSEPAEQELLKLFDGNPPVCPTFKAHRGKHRLFEWRGDLPGGAVLKIGAVEFRTGNDDKGAQSVFPPSVHPEGAIYQWLVGPDDVAPPPLPDEVYARICNFAEEGQWLGEEGEKKPRRDPEHWEKVLAGASKGSRNENLASWIGHMLRSIRNLEDEIVVKNTFEAAASINERNDPPLSEKEVRSTFLSILRLEKNRRATEEIEGVLVKPADKQIEKKKINATDEDLFRATMVDSIPKMWKLHHPYFDKANRGFVLLTTRQFGSWTLLKEQCLEQARYPLADALRKKWFGKEGIFVRLVLNAEIEKAPVESKRPLVVAEHIFDQVEKAKPLADGQKPNQRGGMCRLENGNVVFKVTWLVNKIGFDVDKVTRGEITEVLQEVGVTIYQGVRGLKLRCLNLAAQTKLAGLVWGEYEDPE
jgi:hypothetical protein